MSTRITGTVNPRVDARFATIDATFSAEESTLAFWGVSTTSTISFTSTAHDVANALTSTIGQSATTLAIQPIGSGNILDFMCSINLAATAGILSAGLFYGTASHPFSAAIDDSNVGSTRGTRRIFLAGNYTTTGTATANIDIRVTNGNGSVTTYINTDAAGDSLGGLIKSVLSIKERG